MPGARGLRHRSTGPGSRSRVAAEPGPGPAKSLPLWRRPRPTAEARAGSPGWRPRSHAVAPRAVNRSR